MSGSTKSCHGWPSGPAKQEGDIPHTLGASPVNLKHAWPTAVAVGGFPKWTDVSIASRFGMGRQKTYWCECGGWTIGHDGTGEDYHHSRQAKQPGWRAVELWASDERAEGA